MDTFKETKRLFKKSIQDHLKEHPADHAEREAALPAYAHRNPFIDRLFWGRLHTAYSLSPLPHSTKKNEHILDFGCGTGVFSYFLASNGHSVVGTDVELDPLVRMQGQIAFPALCTFVHASELAAWNQQQFDVIFALDVLEHVDSLDETLGLFKKILTPGGVVVISAPTENIWYALGRWFAGREFSGEYHHTTSSDIMHHCAQNGVMLNERTLYPLVPLFHIATFRL